MLRLLNPKPAPNMGLEDERKMLTGSGDPKEEEEEELVDPLTTVREHCEQLEKAVGTVNHTLPVNFLRCVCGGGLGVTITNIESPRSQAPNLNSHLHY